MGALAGLLSELGHRVSGSDIAFDPPIGPALESWGVRCFTGFDPKHLEPAPDLTIIGNVCRKDNPEVVAVLERGLPYTHIAGALGRFALEGCSPLVVAGTHGKTTTSAMSAHLLEACGFSPGFLIGGLPKNFPRGFRAAKMGKPRLSLGDRRARKPPFVVEGDEYDTAFFEKTAKFLHYRPEVAILTSIEHDHVDIYPDLGSYLRAFSEFVALVPETGLIVANAADREVVRVVEAHARAEVAWFALEGEDTHGKPPHWLAAPAQTDEAGTRFDLYAGGVACGRLALTVPGRHNLKNALAAIGSVAQGYGARIAEIGPALARFEGVRRRQDLIGTPRQSFVYDDFAHHPTAVEETLAALRTRHPNAKLFAVFEPRSATACRRMHQTEYTRAFAAADEVLLAPLGRQNLAPETALDLTRLAEDLNARGTPARAMANVPAIVDYLAANVVPGSVIALLSNGAFGGIHGKLLARLQ